MMTAKTLAFALLVGLFVSACTPKPAVAPSNDAPGGTWSGDYGMGDRRDPIRVDLRWEDGNLRGTLHAGARSMPLSKASFQQDTGAIAFEFDAEGNGGRTVHYVVDGKVAGDTMTGTWMHDDQHGDFSIKKQ